MKNILVKVASFSISNNVWDRVWEQIKEKVGDQIVFEVARPMSIKIDEICK